MYLKVTVLLVASFSAAALTPMTPLPTPTTACRDRYGTVDVTSFRRRSCAWCFFFLFSSARNIFELVPPAYQSLRSKNVSGLPMDDHEIIIEVGDDELVQLKETTIQTLDVLCADLPGEYDRVGCRNRLAECCRRSGQCCRRQLEQRPKNDQPMIVLDYSTDNGDVGVAYVRGRGVTMASASSSSSCPSTWDGFSCWDETPAGADVSQPCPVYMERAIENQQSTKTCTVNGTWFMKSGLEWTDYTICLDKKSYIAGVYVCIVFNVISLALLVPATGLFCVFRDLYRQERVRLHVQFFISLILVSVVSIAWYMLVHYEMLSNPVGTESVIFRNPVWCRLLSFAKIYLTGTNYFWMFCEGYHLHRLISNAFEAPSSTVGLYLIGWLAPAVFAVIYGIVRGSVLNNSCWTKNAGGYQWIIYVPNLLCLAMNLFFLCNILRTLLFQLHAHPHEPSNFRRGLKAGFMLIPLFGIQLLLTIYRPDIGAKEERHYEYITFAITNSQGIFVSLIFCFFNGEVLAHFRRALPSCCRVIGSKDRNRFGATSQAFTHMTTATGYQVHGECESPRIGAESAAASDYQSCASSTRINYTGNVSVVINNGGGDKVALASTDERHGLICRQMSARGLSLKMVNYDVSAGFDYEEDEGERSFDEYCRLQSPGSDRRRNEDTSARCCYSNGIPLVSLRSTVDGCGGVVTATCSPTTVPTTAEPTPDCVRKNTSPPTLTLAFGAVVGSPLSGDDGL